MNDHFEIAVIGAGPGGLSAAANAAHHKVSHVLLEKGEIGNTIFDYQLRKLVMDEPKKLPLRSRIQFKKGSREETLESWNRSVSDLNINIIQEANVSRIDKVEKGFKIYFGDRSITSSSVILALGSMGTPRQLDIPGADLPHVSYGLNDPDAFSNRNIIVVGAGDAAIENALALCEKNRVSLINRKGEFARAKDDNVNLINEAIEKGKIRCYYESSPAEVKQTALIINSPEGEVAVPCDHLIARLGGVLPRGFLEGFGVAFPSHDPSSPPIVDGRYESNIQGLYIIGSLIGYPLIKQAINQGHEVIEHILGNDIEPADQVLIEEKLGHLPGDVNDNLKLIRDSIPVFKELSEPQFRELITESTTHLNKEGDLVFKVKDYTDTFFNIITGSVKVSLPGDRFIEISSGNFFGEMGLLSGRRRSATIHMGEPGILLETPRKQVLKLISSVPSVKRALDQVFMERAFYDIFPNVNRDLLKKVITKSGLKHFKKNDILFKEKEIGNEFFVIRKGSVKISRMINGVDVTQTYLSAGHYVGEMAVMDPEPLPRSATVTAAVACETLVIEKQDFLEFLYDDPVAQEKIAQMVKERRIANMTAQNNKESGAMLDFILSKGLSDADNVLLISSDLCVGCDNCETACASTHDGYSRLDRHGGESYKSLQIPVSCRHCADPLCMTDCPPDALTRKRDGEIIIKDTCIGCGNCEKNCPYDVIQMVYEAPKKSVFSVLTSWFRPKVQDKGNAKAAKCDLCVTLPGGPACVRSCPTGAAMRVSSAEMFELVGHKR